MLADETLGGIWRHDRSVFMIGEGETVHAEGVIAGKMEEVAIRFAAFAAELALW